MNPWLGANRGYLSDWTTQQWCGRPGGGSRSRLLRGCAVRRRRPTHDLRPPPGSAPASAGAAGHEAARDFGGAGFYFVVARDADTIWARHVRQLTERIHIYPDESGELHTDHVFRIFSRVFLRLHYLMPLAS